MRSAGCVVNDILDRKFDKKVFRTKDRPIASGKISIKLALLYSGVLCLLAFLVLINFNFFTIAMALHTYTYMYYGVYTGAKLKPKSLKAMSLATHQTSD